MNNPSELNNRPCLSAVEAVVFDLGKVILDFSFDDFKCYLRECGLEFERLYDIGHLVRVEAYESGQISTDEFFQIISEALPKPPCQDRLRSSWTNIFSLDMEMVNLVRSCRQSYKVAILSNTSELHWNHCLASYDLDNLADHLLPSFSLKLRKPDRRIYRATEAVLGVAPEKILFIDDLDDNISAARECGWQTIRHQSAASTIGIINPILSLEEYCL